MKKTDAEDGLSTGLSLLYVWKAEPITGLTRGLTLALRLLTLVDRPGQPGLEQTQESIVDLYEGAPTPRGGRRAHASCTRVSARSSP